jgi:hypothetical protein
MAGTKRSAAGTSILAATVVVVILAALGYYMYSSSKSGVPPVVAGGSSAGIPDAKEVESAVSSFLEKQRSPLAGKIKIAEPQIAGNYLRVTIIPKDSTAGDKAICFLTKRGTAWQVLVIGTTFEPEFYARFQIPDALRL